MLEFLKAYRKWAFEGGKTHRFFDNETGLCRSAFEWDSYHRGPNHPFQAVTQETAIKRRLRRDFPDNPMFPFGGQDVYYAASDAGNQHLNAERMAWVEKIIGELELFDFLSDWQLWALMAAPDDVTFSPDYGLCDNAPTDSVRALLRHYMRRDFGTSLIPFNENQNEVYEEHRLASARLNAKRMAWVAKMIEELKP